jgi:hypothetical protein
VAGRQLLSAALATLWTAETTESILLSTPAGRTLYEPLGLVAVDEVISCVRGLEDHVLAAIGQPRGRLGINFAAFRPAGLPATGTNLL